MLCPEKGPAEALQAARLLILSQGLPSEGKLGFSKIGILLISQKDAVLEERG